MATITINFDSIDGPSKEFTTCDIDWTSFSAMPAFHSVLQVTQPVNGIEGNVNCILFYQSNSDFGSAFSWLPNTETDNNTLNKYANTYTLVGSPVSEWHSDFAANPSNYTEQRIGTMPPDWGSNPHYMRLINSPSSLDDKRVECFSPVSMNETWDMNEQYYLDETGELVNVIYLKNGYNFATSKGIIAPSSSASSYKGSLVGGAYTFEPFVNGSPYNNWRTNYVFTYPAAVSPVSPIAFSNPENYPNYEFSSRSAWHGTNLQTIASPTIVFNVFISTTIADTQYVGLASIVYNTETGKYTDIGGFLFSANFWEGSIIDPQNESLWGNDGPASIHQGGQGSFDAPSNNHGDNTGTTAGTTASVWGGNHSIFDTGYKKYMLSSPDSTAFAQMVSRLVDPDFWEGFQNKMYNPIQAIIACHMIPASLAPVALETRKQIEAATLTLSSDTVPTFGTLYGRKHIGSINVSDYTDSFADFTNTAIYINLPYIGVKQLDVAACMQGQLSVDYLIDYLTGDTTAWIWTKDRFGNYNIRYEYKGNCAREIPLTQRIPASTQIGSAIIPAAIGTAATLAGAGAIASIGAASAGNAAINQAASPIIKSLQKQGWNTSLATGVAQKMAAPVGQAAQKAAFASSFGPSATYATTGLVSSAGNAIFSGQQIMASNASGGSVSSPIHTQCYLAISRPIWSAPSGYRKLFGYPSDCGGTIVDKFHGFLSVRNIELENITAATTDEKAEIEALMRAGVFVDDIFEPETP